MTDVSFRSGMRVDLIQHMGGDHMVIAAARVSTSGAESEAELVADPQGSAGLIRFLMRNRHGTPFESSAMTFLIEAPIFVFREFHRHRIGWSYSEWSARYSKLAPTFYVPAEDRPLIQVGKAGAYTFEPGTPAQHVWVTDSLRWSCAAAYKQYEEMLSLGIAREVARSVLPVSIYSAMYATCNPRSLMHFLSLRTKNEQAAQPSYPQREIEMVAEQMEGIFADLFPITYQAFNDFGRVAP